MYLFLCPIGVLYCFLCASRRGSGLSDLPATDDSLTTYKHARSTSDHGIFTPHGRRNLKSDIKQPPKQWSISFACSATCGLSPIGGVSHLYIPAACFFVPLDGGIIANFRQQQLVKESY